jgi:hypothetical protein
VVNSCADGTPLSRAGWAAAILWVVGIGARMGFAWAISHGAAPAIERFSVGHSITSVDAWVAALFLMALAELLTKPVGFRAGCLPGAPRRRGR